MPTERPVASEPALPADRPLGGRPGAVTHVEPRDIHAGADQRGDLLLA